MPSQCRQQNGATVASHKLWRAAPRLTNKRGDLWKHPNIDEKRRGRGPASHSREENDNCACAERQAMCAPVPKSRVRFPSDYSHTYMRIYASINIYIYIYIHWTTRSVGAARGVYKGHGQGRIQHELMTRNSCRLLECLYL